MSKKRIKNTESTNTTLIEKVWETFWGVVFLIGIAFLWFFLFGRYHTIFFERAPITPLYAEGWVYQSIEIFSITGIGLAFFSIRTLIKDYKGNIWLQVRKNILYQIAIYLVFLVVTPQYTIQLVPQLFGFTDLKGEYVTNTKLYFFWIDKLGFSYVGDYKFKTLDDAIQGLEYAKKRNDRRAYIYIYRDIVDRLGVSTVLSKYKDDTFYAYIYSEITVYISDTRNQKVMSYLLRNPQIISKNIVDTKLKSYFLEMVEDKTLSNQDIELYKGYIYSKYANDVNEKLDSIPKINHHIAHIF